MSGIDSVHRLFFSLKSYGYRYFLITWHCWKMISCDVYTLVLSYIHVCKRFVMKIKPPIYLRRNYDREYNYTMG